MPCACSMCLVAHRQSVPLGLRFQSLALLSALRKSGRCQEKKYRFPGRMLVNPSAAAVLLWPCVSNWTECFFESNSNNVVSSFKKQNNAVLVHPPVSFAKASRRPAFQSFIKEVFDRMKGLMKKSINSQGTAYWVINKILKRVLSNVAIYGLSSLGQSNLFLPLPHSPALAPSTPSGLQIKGGSL